VRDACCEPMHTECPEPRNRRFKCRTTLFDETTALTWIDVGYAPEATYIIEVYRAGSETAIAEYKAFAADANKVGFMWDAALLAQPPGLYYLDVLIGGAYCYSLKYKKRPCGDAKVVCSTEAAKYNDDCQTIGSSDCATATLPPLVIQGVPPIAVDPCLTTQVAACPEQESCASSETIGFITE
jgi:hypothetical protein